MTNGTHNGGNITFTAARIIKERYLFGTLKNGKITPATKDKLAIAVITDCAGANDHVNVQLLSSNAGTLKVQAGGKIKTGEYIIANENAKAESIEDKPEGTYKVSGIALSDATVGQCVEFTPTLGLEITK